jgi:hypothetical protein
MTRDEIIRMAQEVTMLYVPVSDLERFAALVSAAEREECAKVAEQMLRHYTQAVTGVSEAIRARGKA